MWNKTKYLQKPTSSDFSKQLKSIVGKSFSEEEVSKLISSKENKDLKYLHPLYHNEKHLESTYRIFRLLNLNKKICIINSKDKERIQEQINPEQYKKKTIRIKSSKIQIFFNY